MEISSYDVEQHQNIDLESSINHDDLDNKAKNISISTPIHSSSGSSGSSGSSSGSSYSSSTESIGSIDSRSDGYESSSSSSSSNSSEEDKIMHDKTSVKLKVKTDPTHSSSQSSDESSDSYSSSEDEDEAHNLLRRRRRAREIMRDREKLDPTMTNSEKELRQTYGFHYDYVEAITKLVLWMFGVFGIFWFSGRHEILYQFSKPLIFATVVPMSILLFMYWKEIGENHSNLMAQAQFNSFVRDEREKSTRIRRRIRRK
ncbi:hypothetical protein ScalyP_jg2446 [Parmales sp. scaly parma]|nr:hypothetical protein ScalyP_jg2446 [Parmales sp. scaly parma]|tara:strand:+ start:410 stop:1183 length:774 start_codon:yes stop_codon:yes gene_type:complete